MAPRRRHRPTIEDVEPEEEEMQREESVHETEEPVSMEQEDSPAGVEKMVQLLAKSLLRIIKPERWKGESSSQRSIRKSDPWLDQMCHFEQLRFKGGRNPFENDQWRKRIEHALESLQVPTEEWVRLAVCHFDGAAQRWWLKLKTGEFKGRPVATIEWEEFKATFDKEYFPKEVTASLEEQFWTLTQGSKSVEDYAAEFYKLEDFVQPFRSERTRARKFVAGLKDGLRGQILLGDCMEFRKVVERAIEVDREFTSTRARHAQTKAPIMVPPVSYRPPYFGGSRSSDKRRKLQSGSYQTGSSGSNSVGSARGSVSTRNCYTCGQPSHLSAQCPVRNQGIVPFHCYNCGKPGHMQKQCLEAPRRAGRLQNAPNQGRMFNMMAPNAGPSGGDVVEGKQ